LADIFVSYTSSDRDWAFWIAQELEKLDHTAHVHDWEIGAGGDIASWMEDRHDKADNVLLVVSEVYLSKSYSRWERLAAQWAAAGDRPNFALPVLIENCKLPTLLAQIKRCELFGLVEEEARTRLARYLQAGVRPQGSMRFPGGAKLAATTPEQAASFPGVRQPRNLPLASLGDLFKGREKALEELHAALVSAKSGGVLVRALHGLGGVGKTRLAIEYAWARQVEYSALLFVRAENRAALNANLAALAGGSVLDLREKEAREDEAKIEAVLHWLGDNPTWLMILDNVDDPEAVRAVVELMPRLKGGHLIVTARATNFPATIRKLELDTLDDEPATRFLLERTADDRQLAKDDEAQARTLAHELGGLALALEQAGAHIATDHIGFAPYLKLWEENREKALNWSDPTVTGSERTLATTWATSVARLAPETRRLLERLALLAADPIPDSLLDVEVPSEANDYDARKARAELFAYSLITRAKSEDGQGFVIHHLVQDFARRAMSEERHAEALREALGWVNEAVVGEPSDVRTWPVLNQLAPHALAVARRADEAGIAQPTGRLFDRLGVLLSSKAHFVEAEALSRRALAIDEVSYGSDHLEVAIRLNNLALLLQESNRPDEAEPLSRRALSIFDKSLGTNDPLVATGLNNLAVLLQATNRLIEAEPLFRRALAIDEANYGPDHPTVARNLKNLAGLLRSANRPAEAEPLVRRALAMFETSYGPDHPTVARSLNILADLFRATKRPAEAEPLYRRALAICEKSLGADHPNTVTVRGNLAAIEAARDNGT
jgi:tetratricopeptide (TPR) repeat protein